MSYEVMFPQLDFRLQAKELFGDTELKLDIKKIQTTLIRNALRVHIASIDKRLEACQRCPLINLNPGGFKPMGKDKKRLKKYDNLYRSEPIAYYDKEARQKLLGPKRDDAIIDPRIKDAKELDDEEDVGGKKKDLPKDVDDDEDEKRARPNDGDGEEDEDYVPHDARSRRRQPPDLDQNMVRFDEDAPAPGVDQLIRGTDLMRRLREYWESKGFDRKQAIIFANRAMDPAAPPRSRSVSSSSIEGEAPYGRTTVVVGGVEHHIDAVDPDVQSAAGGDSATPVTTSLLDALDDDHEPQDDPGEIATHSPTPSLGTGDGDDAATTDPTPGDEGDDAATTDEKQHEVDESPEERARQLALPILGSVDEMQYPYEEGKFDDFDEYWPFDGNEITDLPELLKFAPPSRETGERDPAPQQLEIGLLRCMGYDGGDDFRVNVEIENENNRRARIDVDPLDPTDRQADGDINLNQPGYEDIWALLAQFEDQSEEGMRNIRKTHINTLIHKHERIIDGRRYMWSYANEIVLRDTVSQLCFAMKFTKDKSEIPWDPFNGNIYSDETLGAVQWTDSEKTVKKKRDATVFANRAARISTVRALTVNMAQRAITRIVKRREDEERDYIIHYFDMCYQGALEAMSRMFRRIPEDTKIKLGRGGGKRSDLEIQKEQIQDIIKEAHCTEYELQGVMENTIMKVMSILQEKYGWVVRPSLGRMKQLAVNRNANEGFRHYVEFSPAEVWADMFNSDGFADKYKHITLPVLVPDAGHLFDMRELDGGASPEITRPLPRSPSGPGRRRSRLETLRETTTTHSLDPARTGQLSSNYPAQLLSPVASRRVRRSISPEVGRILNLISPSRAGRGRGRAAGRGVYVLPAPARPRVTASSSGTARRPSQRPTRNQAAAGRTAAGNRARAAAQARAAAALIAPARIALAGNKKDGDDDL